MVHHPVESRDAGKQAHRKPRVASTAISSAGFVTVGWNTMSPRATTRHRLALGAPTEALRHPEMIEWALAYSRPPAINPPSWK